MTLKFFLGIRIDSNPVFLSSNRIESNHRTNRIESNRFKIRFDSIRSEP